MNSVNPKHQVAAMVSLLAASLSGSAAAAETVRPNAGHAVVVASKPSQITFGANVYAQYLNVLKMVRGVVSN